MNFTAEELRRLWIDLYRDEVTRLALKGVDRDSLHPAASAHADRHVNALGFDGKIAEHVARAGHCHRCSVVEPALSATYAAINRIAVALFVPTTATPDAVAEAALTRIADLKDRLAAEEEEEAKVRAAEMERVPVESLKEGDRVLLLGTVKDLADGSDWDAARAYVFLDGDEMGDGWTALRVENVVCRAPAQMGDEP